MQLPNLAALAPLLVLLLLSFNSSNLVHCQEAHGAPCNSYCSMQPVPADGGGLCATIDKSVAAPQDQCICRPGFTGPDCLTYTLSIAYDDMLDVMTANRSYVSPTPLLNYNCKKLIEQYPDETIRSNLTQDQVFHTCGCNLYFSPPNCTVFQRDEIKCRNFYAFDVNTNSAVCICSAGYAGEDCQTSIFYMGQLITRIVLNGIFLILLCIVCVVIFIELLAVVLQFGKLIFKDTLHFNNVITIFGVWICVILKIAQTIIVFYIPIANATNGSIPQSFYTLNALANHFSSLWLACCNIILVFRWYILVNSSQKLSVNPRAPAIAVVILVSILIAMHIIYAVAAVVSYTVPGLRNYFDLVAFYMVVLIVVIPIAFAVFGIQMYKILKRANKQLSIFDLKFMKFLIGVQIIAIVLAVLTLVLFFVLNPISTNPRNSEQTQIGATVSEIVFSTLHALATLALFGLFMFLVYDAKAIRTKICCFIPVKKSEGDDDDEKK